MCVGCAFISVSNPDEGKSAKGPVFAPLLVEKKIPPIFSEKKFSPPFLVEKNSSAVPYVVD